jgi:hypothetical protein
MVRKQLEAVLSDIRPDIVKTGMLANADHHSGRCVLTERVAENPLGGGSSHGFQERRCVAGSR